MKIKKKCGKHALGSIKTEGNMTSGFTLDEGLEGIFQVKTKGC